MKNVDKFRLSRCVAPMSQSITKFDCYIAVCLPNDVQEATGEVWIILEHNIIDTAVNELKNRLHIHGCTAGQHFD